MVLLGDSASGPSSVWGGLAAPETLNPKAEVWALALGDSGALRFVGSGVCVLGFRLVRADLNSFRLHHAADMRPYTYVRTQPA